MTIKHYIIAAAAACIGAAGIASAEVTYEDVKARKLVASANTFAELDRNGDHRISRSEAGFDRVMSQTFAEIDTDGDGFVSTAEYAAADKTRNAISSTNESGR